MKDDLHHAKLFFHRHIGVLFVECILLQKSKPDHTRNLKHQFLIVRKHITSNQLYDLIQTIFHRQKIQDLIPTLHECRANIRLIPCRQIRNIL